MIGERGFDELAVELAQPTAASLTSPTVAANLDHTDAEPGGARVVGDVGQVYGMPALGRPEARRVSSRPNIGEGTWVPRGGHGAGKVRLGRRGPAGSGLPATLGNLTLSDATQ